MAGNRTYEYTLRLKDKMTGTMQKASEQGSKTYSRLQKAQSKLNAANQKFGKISNRAFTGMGVAAGAAAAGIVSITKRTAEGIATSERWADRLGVSIERLRELEYAAKQYGVSQGSLIDGMKELTMRTDEFAKTGSGPAAEAFQRLGLGASELNQVKGDTEALFNLVQSRMRGIEDTAKRQRIADELFGGQAAEQMTEMLSATQEQMEKFAKAANEAGYVVGEKTAKQMENFDRQMRHLKAIFAGLGTIIGKQIIPIISKYIEKLKNWIKGHQDLIATKIKEFIRGVANAIQFLVNNANWLISTLKIVIGTIVALKAIIIASQVVTYAAATAMGLYNVALGVTSAMSGSAAIAISSSTVAMVAYKTSLSIATAVQWGFNAALGALLSPITLIIAAISALVVGIIALIKHWDTVKATMMGVWEVIKNGANIIKTYLLSPIKLLVKVTKGLGEVLMHVFSGEFGKAIQAGKDTFASLKNQVISDAKTIKNEALSMGEDFQKGFDRGMEKQKEQQEQKFQLGSFASQLPGGSEQQKKQKQQTQIKPSETQQKQREQTQNMEKYGGQIKPSETQQKQREQTQNMEKYGGQIKPSEIQKKQRELTQNMEKYGGRFQTKTAQPETSEQTAKGITTGGKKQTNINISLENLVDTLNISRDGFDETTEEMQEQIESALLRVLNSANIQANG